MSRRRTRTQRLDFVAAFRRSGLSQRAFAEREGIKLSTLQGWIYRPSRVTSRREPVPRFVRVEGEAAAGVRIQVGTEVVVHLGALPEPEYVVRLVRALAC
jgi:hypothetical protein